jgi:hypothetical protein
MPTNKEKEEQKYIPGRNSNRYRIGRKNKTGKYEIGRKSNK